jgi:hypothetical protein
MLTLSERAQATSELSAKGRVLRIVGKTHPVVRYAVIEPFPVRGDGPNAR